jgi:glucokinase
VDLGGTTVKIAYFDETGNLLDKWEIPTVTADGGSRILPDIAQSVLAYLEAHQISRESILGLGIGVPGPVNGRGVVNKCVNLGWGVMDIVGELSRLTGLGVKAGNDANVAALGEYWKGGGQGCENMVFVTLGTGVGGGVVIEGKLLYGAHGAGAEIGHMVLNRNEAAVCGCGKRGCAEQYCSATGIVNLAKNHGMKDVTCKDIFDSGKAGDPTALAVLAEYYEYLGEFLGSLCTVVDPETVVLGGGVSKAGQVLLGGVVPVFRKYVFHAGRDIQFALASLGNDAGAYGAFKLALDAFA